jgi:hypothetical protein
LVTFAEYVGAPPHPPGAAAVSTWLNARVDATQVAERDHHSLKVLIKV